MSDWQIWAVSTAVVVAVLGLFSAVKVLERIANALEQIARNTRKPLEQDWD